LARNWALRPAWSSSAVISSRLLWRPELAQPLGLSL
jgi:hypothetical protein